MFLEQIASRRLELALASGGSPKKAKIYNLEAKLGKPKYIEVSFNPEKISYKACPRWKDSPLAGKIGGHRMNYGGSVANELSMELLFDTTMTGKSVYDQYIKFLIELTVPIKKVKDQPQPPLCQFVWGKFTAEPHMSFKAVLSGMDVEYKWFLPNGTPVRAKTTVTFKEPEEPKEKDKGTNPTSRSEARRVWRVIEGQTLDWIAYMEYGDSAAWRHIALVNNLHNPRDLRPGMILKLLPLP